MAYEVETSVFSGPFDLLLHLILQDEVDLYEISLGGIIDAYIQEIQKMESPLAEAKKDIANFHIKAAASVGSSSFGKKDILDVRHILNQNRIGSDRKVYRTWRESMKML